MNAFITIWRACAGTADRLLGEMGTSFRGRATSTHDPPTAAARPTIPPIAFFAAGTWAAAALAIDAAFGLESGAYAPGIPVGMAACILASVAGMRLPSAPCMLAAGMGFGMAIACAHCAGMNAVGEAAGSWERPLTLEVTRDSRSGSFASTFIARMDNGALLRVSYQSDERFMVGQRLSAIGSVSTPGKKQERDCWRAGIVAILHARHMERMPIDGPFAMLRQMRADAIGAIDDAAMELEDHFGNEAGEGALFLKAVLLGEVDGLYDSKLYQCVKACGLAHLVAVSGAHLVIVCGAIVVVMRRLAFGRAMAIPLQMGILLSYLVLTGAPVSAQRAAVMSSLSLLSFFAERRPHSLAALSACIIFMVATDPSSAFSGSLRYSALATLGIILFARLFSDWLVSCNNRFAGAVGDAIALTVSASVLTMPLSASQFNQVSLISPLANIVATCAFGFLCVGGMLALAIGFLAPLASFPLLAFILLAAECFCGIVHFMASLPLASIPCAIGIQFAAPIAIASGVGLWLLWPHPTPRAFACAAAALPLVAIALCAGSLFHGDEVVMLDVGQGDAIVIRSGPHAVLIDTGNQDLKLLEGLGSQGIWHLDAVLITHADDDHCGSLTALQGVVGVGKVLVASGMSVDGNPHCVRLRQAIHDVAGEDALEEMRVGDVARCGNITLEAVGPEHLADGGGNADSLTVVLRSDDDQDGEIDHTALFCGDAEAQQLREYCGRGRIPDVDIYKVGHHGSRAAIDTVLAERISPEISIVGVGEGNRYGHPVPETIEILENAGSAVFRTDLQGRITCRLLPDRIEVGTQYG